jgi:hypothetical protein
MPNLTFTPHSQVPALSLLKNKPDIPRREPQALERTLEMLTAATSFPSLTPHALRLQRRPEWDCPNNGVSGSTR